MTQSLFERLKADQLKFRKEGGRACAASLGLMIAESSKQDKNPSDEVVTATLRKAVKALDEVLALKPNHPDSVYEKELLENYLPNVLSFEATLGAVEALDIEPSLKNMKAIKAELEKTFPGGIDGKTLADAIKQLSS